MKNNKHDALISSRGAEAIPIGRGVLRSTAGYVFSGITSEQNKKS